MDTTRRKVALVTGASAGLGAEFARQLAAAGHDVVLVARRLDRLEALAQALIAAHGIKAYAVSADLAQADAHRVVMHAVAARNRSVDILINNAGFTIPDHFAKAEWQRESDMIMTLVYAVCSLHLELFDAEMIDADRPEAHLNLGLLETKLRRPSEAENQYQTALRLDPNFTPALVNLADLDRMRGQNQESTELLRKAMSIDSNNADIRHSLGLALVRQHN